MPTISLKKIQVPFAGVMDNDHDFLLFRSQERNFFAHTGQICHFNFHNVTS
jgi:hypothetical protein